MTVALVALVAVVFGVVVPNLDRSSPLIDDPPAPPAERGPQVGQIDPGPASCEPSEVGRALMEAYNNGDVEAVRSRAPQATIDDPVALTMDPQADVSDIEEWVKLGAAHGDEFTINSSRPEGPTTMLFHTTRTNDRLAAHGLDVVAATYRVSVDSACQVTEFVVDGPLVGTPDPCGASWLVADRPELVPALCAQGMAGPGSRVRHDALTADGTMLVWGGGTDSYDGRPSSALLTYDPSADRWSAFDIPADGSHLAGRAVWTGSELLVVPNFAGDELLHVDPETGSAARVAMPDYAQGAGSGQAVWTGSELIIWGGTTVSTPAARAAYEPASRQWRQIADAPIVARDRQAMVWTGREVLVWGRSDGGPLGDGAAYDPATDSWRELPDAPIDERQYPSAVWTGSELIVWGGIGSPELVNDGAAYNPETNTWRTIADAPLTPRAHHAGVWTGEQMIVWGGWIPGHDDPSADDGAAYNPTTDTWEELPAPPIHGRCGHTAVTIHDQIIIFGGAPCDQHPHIAFSDGAILHTDTTIWTPLANP